MYFIKFSNFKINHIYLEYLCVIYITISVIYTFNVISCGDFICRFVYNGFSIILGSSDNQLLLTFKT